MNPYKATSDKSKLSRAKRIGAGSHADAAKDMALIKAALAQHEAGESDEKASPFKRGGHGR